MDVDVIRCVKQVLLIESFCILCPSWQLFKKNVVLQLQVTSYLANNLVFCAS